MRQRQIDFTGELRIPAHLRLLDVRPERLPVKKKTGSASGDDDGREHDTGTATVVIGYAAARIDQSLTRTVGGRCQCRLALGTTDDLYMKMIARHHAPVRALAVFVNH